MWVAFFIGWKREIKWLKICLGFDMTKKDKEKNKSEEKKELVAGAGFEPTTFGLWARRATMLLHPAFETWLFYTDYCEFTSRLK